MLQPDSEGLIIWARLNRFNISLGNPRDTRHFSNPILADSYIFANTAQIITFDQIIHRLIPVCLFLYKYADLTYMSGNHIYW